MPTSSQPDTVPTDNSEVQRLRQELQRERNTRRELESQLQQEQERRNQQEQLTQQLIQENEQERNRRMELESELRQKRQETEQERADMRIELENLRLQDEQVNGAPDWILSREEIQITSKTLGEGAWATVSEGIFRGSRVAVKRMHHLILSQYNVHLFEREMAIAARCRHPNLLQFIGATKENRQAPLIVMEILETSLRSVLEERELEPEEVITISLDVARALNYLHLNKPSPIIHRDLSSANVLLWRHGNAWRGKVSDYGTANVMKKCTTINPGAVVYSAPEAQTTNQSPKLDVFSFGVLLCEMFIRKLPDDMPRERRRQIDMVSSPELKNLIIRCVAHNPEQRPSMDDVITLLQRLAAGFK